MEKQIHCIWKCTNCYFSTILLFLFITYKLENTKYGGYNMNLYHRKDGRWEGRITKAKEKNGRRHFFYFFGKTKDEVIQKMQKKQKKAPEHAAPTVTFSDAFQKWLQNIRLSIKESTCSNYTMKAQKHLLPTFGTMKLCEISADEIYTFIAQKQKAGLSNRYISDILVLLKSIFKYSTSIYHTANPMTGIAPLKKNAPEIQVLSQNHAKKLQHMLVKKAFVPSNLGILLSMATGIRIGELCALQWNDIDLEKRVLTVKKTIQRIQCPNQLSKTKLILTEPKTESSKRTVPIPEYMADILKAHAKKSSVFLVSGKEKPMEPRTLQYRFARILKNGKLPSIHFHALRHMFATNCIQLGFDVKTLSELLGHASVETTLNKYVHSSFAQKAMLMDRLHLFV